MQTKKVSMTKVIVVAVIVIAGAVAILVRGGALPVDKAVVVKAPISACVEERAVTSLPVTHAITMPLFGDVLPIDLAEGSSVTQGQVVARINAANLQTALLEAQHCIAAFSSAVDSAKAKIAASEANMQLKKWTVEAQAKLFANQQVSEQDFKIAKTETITTEIDYQSDNLNYHAMQAFSAALNLMPVYLGRYLVRTEIASPINGVVLKRYVAGGQVLMPGAQLLDLGAMAELQVTADVLSDEATRVRPGQKVEIVIATGSEPLAGMVARVNPAGFTKVSSLGVEEQRVPVIIAFKAEGAEAQAERNLGVGYRVRVRIETDKREQALVIPIAALFRDAAGKWKTFVVRKGRAHPAEVKTGITNHSHAEILEGLAEGDEIVVAPPAEIKAGSRVRPASG